MDFTAIKFNGNVINAMKVLMFADLFLGCITCTGPNNDNCNECKEGIYKKDKCSLNKSPQTESCALSDITILMIEVLSYQIYDK